MRVGTGLGSPLTPTRVTPPPSPPSAPVLRRVAVDATGLVWTLRWNQPATANPVAVNTIDLVADGNSYAPEPPGNFSGSGTATWRVDYTGVLAPVLAGQVCTVNVGAEVATDGGDLYNAEQLNVAATNDSAATLPALSGNPAVSVTGATLVTAWDRAVTWTGFGGLSFALTGDPSSPRNLGAPVAGDGTATVSFDLETDLTYLVMSGDVCTVDALANTFKDAVLSANAAVVGHAVTNNSTIDPLTFTASLASPTSVLCTFAGQVTVSAGATAIKVNAVTATGVSQANSKAAGLGVGFSITAGTVTVPFRDPSIRNGQGAYVQAGQVVIGPP